ncbi:transposase [Kocuria rhizophila]|nr:transposase [Kocuria rhizophila]
MVQAEEGPRRGRPRTDIRTIVDAALYKTRTGITWRELRAAFGPWQTALQAPRIDRKLPMGRDHWHCGGTDLPR